ncbi:hypothetical protein M413DRAFT_444330 [Hebeloma cylindrosporum]|uniref:Uncharacterized protein n=1 Tax=Hebeloma cylindrosporum TaxID=76867 RepID=A0A0C2YNR6_HEBCY|nr:hypothetical protein M413DRAFT_444330 [Hebeloma cylindrosporum h7]
MTWYPAISYTMQRAITQRVEPSAFNGPYDGIIHQLFETGNYMNCPHFLRPGVNEPFWYEVQEVVPFSPIFFLEIRALSALDSVADREKADLQTRERMVKLVGQSPLRVLHGVSAMGPYLCFYKYDKDHPELGITPSISLVEGGASSDTTPRELWNYDVMNEEGENKLRGIAEEVKRACSALAF